MHLRLTTIARLVVTALGIWLVFRSVDWAAVVALLVHADPRWLVLAALAAAVQFALMVVRWQIVMKMLSGASVAMGQLALGLGRSMLFSQIMPSTVGGDVVRVIALTRHTGAALAARSVIADRVLGLAVLMVFVVTMLPFLATLLGYGQAFAALMAVSFGGLLLFAALLAHSEQLCRLPWIGKYSVLIAADLKRLFAGRTMTLVIVLLAFMTHLLSVIMICALAHALGTSLTFLQSLAIVPSALLISAIPISLGGWGLREGALAAGFALVGAGSAGGVAASVLFGLTPPLIGAITEAVVLFLRLPHEAQKNAT